MLIFFRVARGSRGTRQLKDFMGDGGDRAVNRQQQSAGDQLSDGHEAVESDSDDNENAAHRQLANHSGGRRGRGRPGTSARGRYTEMRQQSRDSYISERPRYSNVRGRGFRDDGGGQRQNYDSRVNKQQEVFRDVEYCTETNRGPGKQAVADRQKNSDRQPTNTRSGQSQEDWKEGIDTSHSNKPMEQHRDRFHAANLQSADSKVSDSRPSHNDYRVSNTVRSQWQEDKHVPREPSHRIHTTRTICNRTYQTADNIPTKDRSSQIGGIVDAMNKISVKTAAEDRRDVSMQENVAPKSVRIVSGMHY